MPERTEREKHSVLEGMTGQCASNSSPLAEMILQKHPIETFARSTLSHFFTYGGDFRAWKTVSA
jgi:hypothetical protein